MLVSGAILDGKYNPYCSAEELVHSSAPSPRGHWTRLERSLDGGRFSQEFPGNRRSQRGYST
jgi:hypothetical protein